MDNKWQKVREIFDGALGQRPEERSDFVAKACGNDKTLIAEVESLLSSLGDADSFMERPAVENVADVVGSESKKLEPGKVFGQYEIIRQIGEGGMGEVYLARDNKLDRNVAFKILNEQYSGHQSNLKRFVREAKTASALNHPNILVVHDVGESDGAHFIVSEYIEGKTLRERLRESELTLGELLEIATQTAAALTAAHEANLVHRDIKPENIMIRPDGFVKVLDFGLAKLVEQENKSLLGLDNSTVEQNPTAKGMILGTINYMSPEQARGQAVDKRTDIFSLGAVLYEMLAGTTPFAGETTSDAISSILTKDPEPLSTTDPDVPEALENVVMKALAKDREKRYPHTSEMLADLKAIKYDLDFGQIASRSGSASQRQPRIGGKADANTEDQQNQTKSSGQIIFGEIDRHRRGVLAAVALLLLSAAGLAYWFSSGPASSADLAGIRSVAVLPLENLSGDASQDYFADGMTEALIGDLSRIGALKVISRTSAMRYKGSGKSIPEIARELNVDGVIEGSVQRAGERIRINAQLIHAATDSPIWSRSYERSVSDILKLQSEIAQAVASEISVQLTPEEQTQFRNAKSLDPSATEAFLLGRHYFHKWTKESERQAVEQFQKAVIIEPDYADAWAGLADAWTVRAMVGDIPIPEAEKPTRDAATRALAIDPQNAAAHISMCFIYNNYDFDWVRSEESCKRGIQLDPNNAKGHFAYAYVLARLERWDEMSEQMETAMRLDPAEPWWPAVYGQSLVQARRFEEAEIQLNRALTIDPDWWMAFRGLFHLYIELGKFDEALKVAEKRQYDDLSMAYLYARKGDRQKARELLNQSTNKDPFELAQVYAAIDDFDNAFRMINGSLDRREGFMFGYVIYLVFDRFKSDPRWAEVASRLNLPDKR